MDVTVDTFILEWIKQIFQQQTTTYVNAITIYLQATNISYCSNLHISIFIIKYIDSTQSILMLLL